MMNKCRQDVLDALPEPSEKEVSDALERLGMGAFTPCDLRTSLDCGEVQTPLQNGVIRFPSGFLKLTCGVDAEARHFVAIDFHDYREAIFDHELVCDAYLRFAGIVRAWLYANGARPDLIECACCPERGAVFLAIDDARHPPATDALMGFLASYFRSGQVVNGLHQSFGEAALARARATIPSLVAVLAT